MEELPGFLTQEETELRQEPHLYNSKGSTPKKGVWFPPQVPQLVPGALMH